MHYNIPSTLKGVSNTFSFENVSPWMSSHFRFPELQWTKYRHVTTSLSSHPNSRQLEGLLQGRILQRILIQFGEWWIYQTSPYFTQIWRLQTHINMKTKQNKKRFLASRKFHVVLCSPAFFLGKLSLGRFFREMMQGTNHCCKTSCQPVRAQEFQQVHCFGQRMGDEMFQITGEGW